LREVWDGIVVVWWRFFDWLAVVSWKKLLLVSVLGLILTAMLSSVGSSGHRVSEAPKWFFLLIVASVIIKVVAGGKRRAEVTANEATKQAETEQLERTVLEARMEALQAQIEPHFLFNTLASIDQLIRTDPPRASQMQQSLIRYLRSAMPQLREGGRPTLGQQVDLSKAYLDIMAVRMEERLTAVINVPDVLRSAVFPAMMLQTLVENAIKHGLEPLPGGGTIWVIARESEGRLLVTVADDGRGFSAEGGGTGVGLKNVRERLRLAFGDKASFSIVANYPKGVAATIALPLS